MSGKTGVSKMNTDNKILECPRDRSTMDQVEAGDAHIDVCGKCGGQFFDAGEMFAAFGVNADPSYWDRDETGGGVKDGTFPCPRCRKHMLAQDIKYEKNKVEIDRCGHCGGIWLDKGEVEAIMKIGEEIKPMLDAQTAKAKEDLDKMGEVDFGNAGLIARFLGLFSKKK
ncbi:MAG: zf-TFIIB domain-containing protein [Polyangiaceae bacterium]